MAKDHLRSAITTHLAPLMASVGFQRNNPKTFVRLRGEILEGVGFQVSQWGGKGFYLHHNVNLISNPIMSPDSYRVGTRIDGPDDETTWEGSDEESANVAIQSVARVMEETVLPWFQNFQTPRDYVAEYIANPETTLDSLDICVALLRVGLTNRPYWLCEKLREPSSYAHPLSEYQKKQIECADYLLAAIDRSNYTALLDSWKQENIEKHKLGALVTPQ